jgi:uncharacterized protein YjbI with pentapeptide repeats
LTYAGFDSAKLAGTNLQGATLTGAGFYSADLTGANLTNANLTSAYFSNADLTAANLSGANVHGASFGSFGQMEGALSAQLYSTTTYQEHDLAGIAIYSDVSGFSFAGQNLTNASFGGNYFTPNRMVGTDFTGATIRGANFAYTGITAAQLYSTASYQAGDLRGINFSGNDLTGFSFVGQNLSNATFNAFWSDAAPQADFSQANLTNAHFGILPSNRHLAGADLRGATIGGTVFSNDPHTTYIGTNGHVSGLDLTQHQILVVRNYFPDAIANPDASSPFPITVDQYFTMDPTGTLRVLLDASPWGSPIQFHPTIFYPTIPVDLGSGTLDLEFAPGTEASVQIGRTIHLFDWAGVSPTGTFNVESSFSWDLSQLYTTGDVTLLGSGDPNTSQAANANIMITPVPEPQSLALAVLGIAALAAARSRRKLIFSR